MKIELVVYDESLIGLSQPEFQSIADAFNTLVVLCRNNPLVVSLSSWRDVRNAALHVQIETANAYESDLVALQTIFPDIKEIQQYLKK